MASELRCRLADHRRARGLSVTALATRAGVSRQALTAIEAGRATPSTAVALRLARELRCRVEALFELEADAVPDLEAPELAGRRVVLGRVGERWVAHALAFGSTEPADGLVDGRGRVEPLQTLDALESVALVAGCAPPLGALTGHAGARWLQASSGDALRWLAEGRAHVAGLHLADHDRPDVHDAITRDRLPGVGLCIVSLVGWREGLAVAHGNPLGIGGPHDLGRVRVARRPAGSGAARVLERALARAGLDRVDGPHAPTHLDAAMAVRHGAADAAVLVEPLATALGLPFVPLAEERFELVARDEHLAHPGVARLLDRLASARFAREVLGMGAYDVRDLGARRRIA